MTCFLVKLPLYMFKGFVQDWLTAVEVCGLDSSLCNCKERELFLHNVNNVVVNVVVNTAAIALCIDWCSRREILFCTLKVIYLYEDKPSISSVLPLQPKLRSMKLTICTWNIVNIVLKENHPILEDIIIESKTALPFIKCCIRFPSSVRKLTINSPLVFIMTDEETMQLFSRVDNLQILCLKFQHNLLSFHSFFSVIVDRVRHTLTTLRISLGSYNVQSDLELIAQHCRQLVTLDLNVDCDEVNLTCLQQLPLLSSLTVKRIVLWEFDSGTVLPSLTHLSVNYDRLQGTKLKFFPSLTKLTLNGGNAPKVARILMWLREFENIIIVDVKMCAFLQSDKVKLVKESVAMRERSRYNFSTYGNNKGNNECSADRIDEHNIKWIFE